MLFVRFIDGITQVIRYHPNIGTCWEKNKLSYWIGNVRVEIRTPNKTPNKITMLTRKCNTWFDDFNMESCYLDNIYKRKFYEHMDIIRSSRSLDVLAYNLFRALVYADLV